MARGITDIDKGWGKVRQAITAAAGKSHTKVGFPSEAVVAATPKGTAQTMLEQVQIAAVHEFGAPKRNVPERSFLRTTYDENISKLSEISKVEAQDVISGKTDMRTALSRMGEWLAAKMKNKIKNRIAPPLSPATVKTKGSDVPLIDTAQMIQSITHVEVLRG